MSRISGFRISAIIISLIAVISSAQAEVKKPPLDEKAAVVNGMPVYREELDEEIIKIQKAILGYGKPLTVSKVKSVQKDVLESLIRQEILYQESLKSGIKPDEKSIDKEIKTLIGQFKSETDYKNALNRRNISPEMLRSRLLKNNVLQQYIGRLAEKTSVSDNDIIEYYQGRIELFKQPLQVRVSHIFIRTDPKWDAPRKQEERRKAEQILKDIKQGKDFAVIAGERSDGPTKTKGGDLGYIKMGQLDNKLEDAVFKLKTGELSNIVETDNGFHIFKATDKKPETVLSYEDVKEKIRQFLHEEKAKREADQQAGKLREKATVEILLNEEGSLAKIQ